MEEQDVVMALSALAHDVRLRVFRALVVAGPAGLTPSVLCDQLNVPATSLSFHLKELLHAKLLTQSRDGRHLIYRANFACMNGVLGYLTAHCCEGMPCNENAPVQACITC